MIQNGTCPHGQFGDWTHTVLRACVCILLPWQARVAHSGTGSHAFHIAAGWQLTSFPLSDRCRFGDQVRVIGNTGSNSTREAVHATSQGFAVGMHAALQINPYYGKTSHDGLRTHFEVRLAIKCES